MATSVHIVATGARTPLGLEAEPSAAAYRAGISAMGDHPFMIDRLGDPMPGAIDAKLDSDLMGPDRLLALAESALLEACTPLNDAPRSRSQLPIYLGLPELRPGFSEQDVEAVRSGLAQLEGLSVGISEVATYTSGHTAGLMALTAATEKIQQGAFEACLVGGVDSYFQPDTMEWLDENRQLAGADARSAFIPGEGAGFCLLMTERARKRMGLDTLARVLAASIGEETKLIKTPDVCLGDGLTATIRSAVRSINPPAETINDVICDINGERYRGEEWGFVCLRLPQYFDDPTAYRSPADSWGDMGAASGPLFAMLACQAAAKGYAKGAHALLWTSSEGGLRGAAMLGFEDMGRNRRGGYHG